MTKCHAPACAAEATQTTDFTTHPGYTGTPRLDYCDQHTADILHIFPLSVATPIAQEAAMPQPERECCHCRTTKPVAIKIHDPHDGEERDYCALCWASAPLGIQCEKRYRDAGWEITDYTPRTPDPPPHPQPTLAEQLEALLATPTPTTTVHPKGAPVTAATVAPTINPVLTARVISGDAASSILEVTLPGEAQAQMLRTTTPFPRNETVHVEVAIEQRARALRVALPGDLPLTPVPTTIAHIPTVATIHAPAPPPIPAGELPPGLSYVTGSPHFYIAPELEAQMEAFEQMNRAGHYVKIRLIGESGTGKTEWAYHYAARYNRPFAKIDGGNKQSPESWFGMRTFRAGEDSFQKALLTTALQTPRAVILIDEGNRTHGSNHASLMGVFDDTRSAWIDEIQQQIDVVPSVTVMMSLNVGPDYSGTYNLDKALRTRFPNVLEFRWLPPLEEGKILVLKTGVSPKIASELVEFAGEIRRRCDPNDPNALDETVSTRVLIATANLIAAGGLDPATAVKTTILPEYSTEGGDGSQRADVGKIIQLKWGQ